MRHRIVNSIRDGVKETRETPDGDVGADYLRIKSRTARAAYWLKDRQVAMTAGQLLDAICEYDEEIKENRTKIMPGFSAAMIGKLKPNVKTDRMMREKIKGEYYFGLPKWFDESGKLKAQYRPKL